MVDADPAGIDYQELGRLMGIVAGDAKLARLVDAWPGLPECMRKAIGLLSGISE